MKKKVGENNGQLRFVRHHVWRTQARLDQKEEEEKSRWKQWPALLRPPPRVAHASTPGPKKATWQWQLFIASSGTFPQLNGVQVKKCPAIQNLEAPLSHQAIERLFQNPFPAENYRECVRSGSTQEGIHLCNTCSKLTIQADVKKTELLFLTDRLLDILKSKSKLVRARVKSVVTQRFCTCVPNETSFAQMER